VEIVCARLEWSVFNVKSRSMFVPTAVPEMESATNGANSVIAARVSVVTIAVSDHAPEDVMNPTADVSMEHVTVRRISLGATVVQRIAPTVALTTVNVTVMLTLATVNLDGLVTIAVS